MGKEEEELCCDCVYDKVAPEQCPCVKCTNDDTKFVRNLPPAEERIIALLEDIKLAIEAVNRKIT